MGFCSLMDISRAVFQNAYLGYGVLSPYWGQGYGKEIVRAVMDIGFKELGIHRLEAGIEDGNVLFANSTKGGCHSVHC